MASSAYGSSPQAPSYGVAPPTEAMGTADFGAGWRSVLDPGNPLFWLGGFMALTVGLASVAGSVRLGKASFKASAGS